MPNPNSSLPKWRHAHGESAIQGRIKQSPGDFQVVESLSFSLSGDGEHDFLWIEKVGANTAWVAGELAVYARVPRRDVGYAGLKDRHAITRQWFSVRRPGGSGTDWTRFVADGARVIDVTRHRRKLKRGAHDGNGFRIAVRSANIARTDVAKRLEAICDRGVPNYFGGQRFGRNGNNLKLATSLFNGKRMRREQRSIALSAARSFLFNEILSARIAHGSWDCALPGDTMNLDGSGSIFVPGEIDQTLRQRIATHDVHPTGAMWGDGDLSGGGEPAGLERDIAGKYPAYALGLRNAQVKMARRALRLSVKDMRWEFGESVLWIEFNLGRGSYATAVLRELLSESCLN